MYQLPSEMVAHILTFLPGRDLNRFKQLSTNISSIIRKHQKEMQLIAVELECTSFPIMVMAPHGTSNDISPALVIRVKRNEICVIINNKNGKLFCEPLRYKGVFNQITKPGVNSCLESYLKNIFKLVTITKLQLTSPWDNCQTATEILVRCLKDKTIKRIELTEGDVNILSSFEEDHFKGKPLLISTSFHLEMIARRASALGKRFPFIILKARQPKDITRGIFYILSAFKHEIPVPMELKILSDLYLSGRPVDEEDEEEEELYDDDLDITTKLHDYPQAFIFYSRDRTKFVRVRIIIDNGCTTVICSTHQNTRRTLKF